MHGLALAAALAVLPMLGGCGIIGELLGSRHGYLFQGSDVLCYPGEAVELTFRLQHGEFLGDKPDRTVLLSLAGRQFGQAVTDREGYARFRCVAPDRPGDYRIIGALADAEQATKVGPAALLLAVRNRDQPIIVTDVDQTLEMDGFRKVLAGHPRPMPDAVRVLHRLHREAGYTIVYLTLRPDFLEVRTRAWLAEYDFPEGPVFYSDEDVLLKDRAAYKPRVLRTLICAFPNVRAGIGDKAADCQAYRSAGLPLSLLIVRPQESAKDRQAQAAQLAQIDGPLHAVTSWRQIEQVLFEQAAFPQSDMIDLLRHPPASQPD